ncbi:FAD-dependent oxidoreductase [Trichothermofontia sp.]
MAAALGGCAGGGHTRKKTRLSSRRILVIGAGLASLAAAWTLHRQRYDVQIVEARDRVGGRVWTGWVSLQPALRMPILVGFNAAEQGQAMEQWSDRQIVASAMAILKTIFGAGIPQPVAYQITRWATDPFALGAYSYYAVGSTPKLRQTLATPLGKRLFFAGEATHPDFFVPPMEPIYRACGQR